MGCGLGSGANERRNYGPRISQAEKSKMNAHSVSGHPTQCWRVKKNLVQFLQSQVFLQNHEIDIGANESSDGDGTKRIDKGGQFGG